MSAGIDALFSLLVFSILVLLLRVVFLRKCDSSDPEPRREDPGEPR